MGNNTLNASLNGVNNLASINNVGLMGITAPGGATNSSGSSSGMGGRLHMSGRPTHRLQTALGGGPNGLGSMNVNGIGVLGVVAEKYVSSNEQCDMTPSPSDSGISDLEATPKDRDLELSYFQANNEQGQKASDINSIIARRYKISEHKQATLHFNTFILN